MASSTRCKSATMIEEEERLSDPTHTIKVHTSLLREQTLEEVAIYMKEIQHSKIVVISGARISLPLDIPDFRSPDVGNYHAPFDYDCYCCDAFNKRYFMNEPAPLYKITSFMLEQHFRPTFSHYFIAFLEHKNLLLKNYSQNMDDLEKLAGVTRCTQINGSFFEFMCINCGEEYSLEWARVQILRKKIPLCTKCASLIKPNVLLYGEEIPVGVYEELDADIKECKLLIILGSTLSEEPLATVLRGLHFEFPRVFISDVDPYDFSDFHFYCQHENNDVIRLGDIDSTCKKLVKLLGWSKELYEFADMEFREPEEL